MANRYGEAALMAAQQENSTGISPIVRWERAMDKLYPTSLTARRKGGPRGAFLGLCEEGMVKGIPSGSYTNSKDDKAYAVGAAALLIAGTRKWSISELWQEVTDDPERAHNSQMDIVMSLWKNELLVGKP